MNKQQMEAQAPRESWVPSVPLSRLAIMAVFLPFGLVAAAANEIYHRATGSDLFSL
eukprot:CAMPEP_0202874178 /NCGR_PEP_ID=MMETSP1391-20130828/24907_1 /ASSEMBLY_ACC=CAM_ASM_000867 /TAXON_ID=1034604 /ORGANISM="Chlamydomonas leiostraca, Strain SAG 11-49" /LENGTH=55 /DNA_ID=CAMNT_0049555563 /DNA_START=48 /DNA_END=215 /DNA_ORIENTATION=+